MRFSALPTSKGKAMCIEKAFLFFEHKGTRIFETRKPLFKKKPHIPCFLNYQPILTNKTLLFLHKTLFMGYHIYQRTHSLCHCGPRPAISYFVYLTQHVASLLV